MDIENPKRGRFVITRRMIEQFTPKDLNKVFKDMLIILANDNFCYHGIEYVAIGDMFKEVPEGELIPRYTPIITGNKDDSIKKIEWRIWK